MLITSAIMTAASGSVGGVTASRNRFGMYLRARAMPVNPNTTFQQAVRAQLAAFATRWSTLTVLQRDTWEVYAKNTPTENALGQTVTLTGFQQYVRSNTARAQGGLAAVDDGPAIFGLPTFTPVSVTVLAVAGVGITSVAFTDTDAWANETGGALLYGVSRPVSPTINFFKGPFRFIEAVLGDDTTPPTSPEADVSPFPMTTGQRMYSFIRVCLADGRLSSAQIDSAIAT